MPYPEGPSSPPPSIPAPSGQGPVPPRPQVVHVVAKPGGFWRAIAIVGSLFLFGLVFAIGITFGVLVMVAGAGLEQVVVQQTYRDGGGDTIAIIPVEGAIDNDQAEFVHAAVKHVLDDGSFDAVVLRVDSPGGGVTPSDQIWYEVERLKQAGMPVIASYGGVAASGGYYISCGADHIMAEETTITGSIGVIAQVLTLEGLMDKVGVNPVTIVASGSPEKDVANNMFRNWNEADIARIRTVLDSAYTIFNTRVKNGRGKVITDPARLNAIADGSIYTAAQAHENGLIDSIGYLDDAIGVAESAAGVSTGTSTVIAIKKTPSLGDALFGGAAASAPASRLDAETIRSFVNELGSPRLMYLMH